MATQTMESSPATLDEEPQVPDEHRRSWPGRPVWSRPDFGRLRVLRAPALWACLACVLLTLVLLPQTRFAVWALVQIFALLVIGFLALVTRTVRWSFVGRLFAASLIGSAAVAAALFTLTPDPNATTTQIVGAGLGQSALGLLPLAAVALAFPRRVRRFTASDWLLLGFATGLAAQAVLEVARGIWTENAPASLWVGPASTALVAGTFGIALPGWRLAGQAGPVWRVLLRGGWLLAPALVWWLTVSLPMGDAGELPEPLRLGGKLTSALPMPLFLALALVLLALIALVVDARRLLSVDERRSDLTILPAPWPAAWWTRRWSWRLAREPVRRSVGSAVDDDVTPASGIPSNGAPPTSPVGLTAAPSIPTSAVSYLGASASSGPAPGTSGIPIPGAQHGSGTPASTSSLHTPGTPTSGTATPAAPTLRTPTPWITTSGLPTPSATNASPIDPGPDAPTSGTAKPAGPTPWITTPSNANSSPANPGPTSALPTPGPTSPRLTSPTAADSTPASSNPTADNASTDPDDDKERGRHRASVGSSRTAGIRTVALESLAVVLWLIATAWRAVVVATCALIAYAVRDKMVILAAHAGATAESRLTRLVRGRAAMEMTRHARQEAFKADNGPVGRSQVVAWRVAAGAVLTLLPAALWLAHQAVQPGAVASDPIWLTGYLSYLGPWWSGLVVWQQVLLVGGTLALVTLAAGSLGTPFGVSGAASYLASHGHGAATFVRDPRAAAGTYLRTVTPVALLADSAEWVLTFVPVTFGGAVEGRSVRATAEDYMHAFDLGGVSGVLTKAELFSEFSTRVIPEHGYHDVVIQADQGTPETVFSPRTVARLILKDAAYAGGPVRLILGAAGGTPEDAAQELADRLGVQVLAPSDTVFVFDSGAVVVGPSPLVPSGEWIVFRPGAEQ